MDIIFGSPDDDYFRKRFSRLTPLRYIKSSLSRYFMLPDEYTHLIFKKKPISNELLD